MTARTNSNIQAGFYVTLAALPASVALYQITSQGSDAYFTRVIRDTYGHYSTKWAQRNDLHTQAMEQAAADRVLFLNESSKNPRFVDIRFPEYVHCENAVRKKLNARIWQRRGMRALSRME